MINEKTAIKIETSYSDDKKHRYLLYRSWDKNLPSACIIMLNPNSNSILESDVTSMLVLNNIVKLGYGSIRIVNRYSFITPKLRFKWQSDEILTLAENDAVIKQSDDSSDSPESIIMESMLEGMSEYYSKNLSREVCKGMKETAYKCLHTGVYTMMWVQTEDWLSIQSKLRL